MKMFKNLPGGLRNVSIKPSLTVSLFLLTNFSYAADKSGDIVKTLIGGSIGLTLSKDGSIWTLLTAITFVVGAFYAAIKKDPKEFIPAFIIMGIISTITGVFLTF